MARGALITQSFTRLTIICRYGRLQSRAGSKENQRGPEWLSTRGEDRAFRAMGATPFGGTGATVIHRTGPVVKLAGNLKIFAAFVDSRWLARLTHRIETKRRSLHAISITDLRRRK